MIMRFSSNLYQLVKRMLKLMSKNSIDNVKNNVKMLVDSIMPFIAYFK